MCHVRYQRPSPAPSCLSSPRNCRRSGRSADRTHGCGLYLQPAQITIPLPPTPKPNIPKPPLPEPNIPKPKSLPNRNRSDSALHRPCPGPTGSNLSKMNSYAKCATNPCGIHTSKIIGLKASCNEHLQKKGGGEHLLLPNGHPRREGDGNQITTAFPVTSELFARSFAPARESTPLVSCVCAVFCGNRGVAEYRRKYLSHHFHDLSAGPKQTLRDRLSGLRIGKSHNRGLNEPLPGEA